MDSVCKILSCLTIFCVNSLTSLLVIIEGWTEAENEILFPIETTVNQIPVIPDCIPTQNFPLETSIPSTLFWDSPAEILLTPIFASTLTNDLFTTKGK